MIDFYEEPNDPGAPALIAALIAAGLLAAFAAFLIAGQGTSADSAFVTDDPAPIVAERYPQPGDKFAPDRLAEPLSAYVGGPEGEPLFPSHDGSVGPVRNY